MQFFILLSIQYLTKISRYAGRQDQINKKQEKNRTRSKGEQGISIIIFELLYTEESR